MDHEMYNCIESHKWTDCSTVDNGKRSLTDKCLATYIEKKMKSEVNNCALQVIELSCRIIIIHKKSGEGYIQICTDSFSDIHKRKH